MRQLHFYCLLFVFVVAISPRLPGQAPPASNATLQPKDMIGYWAVQESGGDILYIILKSGSEVSSFWSGSSTNRMEKGSWEIDANKVLITWNDGYRDVLARSEDGFIKYELAPDQSLDTEPETVLTAVRIQRRDVGQWRVQNTGARAPAVPSTTEEESDRPIMRNEFVGFWEISGKRINTFYLHLKRDGKAQSAYREHRQAPKSIEGEWVLENNEARITWDDDHHDMISNTGENYKLRGFSSRSKFDAKAVKIEPAQGQVLFSAGYTSLANIDSFEGIWEVYSQDDNYFIEIKNWGQSARYWLGENRNIREVESGRWKLLSMGLMIVWKDGSKDVLRLTQKGMQKDSFSKDASIAGEPLNQSPAKKAPEEIAELISRKSRSS